MNTDVPTKSFKSAKLWEKWLGVNHAKSDGIWLQIFKVGSGHATVTRSEALDVALCYGWIDGQGKSYDSGSWLQKYTPRRPRSIWSKRNQEHVARLSAEGRMHVSGQKAIEAAQQDGRWAQAYDSPANMRVPDDFLKALAKNKKAEIFFHTLNKANTYAIAWRLQTAKNPETREKRMKVLLEKMAKGEKLH
ncbi:MAG: YdeI/OmpD-associated family protein [Candidatus Pacebacteria bacterium]|nr:YdeI/OmpD-associated family protein [Candidatus Paceibacterota bacterium]